MYFQYFFPNRQTIKLPELLAAGLGYVFDPETSAPSRDPFTPRGITNGPGGQHGLLVSLSDDYCGFYRDAQVWKQEIGCDYWVGMWTAADKRPMPETLARANQIMGQYLRLDDGHDWLLPKARHWVEFEETLVYQRTLPTQLARDEQGRWRPGEVKARYRELWRMATEFMQAMQDGDSHRYSEFDNLVIECFRTNYRVSAIELDLLGVYDDHVRERVPAVLLDLDNFDTLVKKKLTTPDFGLSTVGPAASPPAAETEATTPQSAT